MSKSEFARKQLQKYGWKEGAGLGKDEGGRSEAIKVSLKMDKAGVGHDPGKEFTDHWWLRVFNDAAKKIGSKKEDTIHSTQDQEIQIKKKKAEKKAQLYKGFVKSSLLANGVEEKHEEAEVMEKHEHDREDTSEQSSIPTLDDIHKFCGGATGHRAAMFGIKMKGKLSRVARQDLQFEEQQRQKEKLSQNGDISIHTDHSVLLSGKTVADDEDSKSKHKKKNLNKEETEEKYGNFSRCDSFHESSGNPEKQIKTKKRKKDKKAIEKSFQEGSESEDVLNHSKCSQEHFMVNEHALKSVDVRSCDSPKQKKRKKRKSEGNSNQIVEESMCLPEGKGLEINYTKASETSEGGHSKKKRKRERFADSKQTSEETEENKEKHRKKKRKKDKTA